MEISEFTEVLMEAKEDKGLSFEDLGKVIGRSEMWTAALLFGQSKATEEEARKITSALGLVEEEEAFVYYLSSFPSKGLGPVVPTDPLSIVSTRSCRSMDSPSRPSSMRSSVTVS